MAIQDYLQGINNATTGEKTDVKTASADLSNLQAGAGSLPSKLKEALNTKLNNNKDIIDQQSATMQNYFNSGAEARAKYADVFNPFEKAKLVQQERSMALRPYDTLSGVLENRMGQVSDIVTSGVQGWQGLVDSATTRLGTAKDMLSTALSSYLSAADQQQAADDMAFKIAQAEEASRQFQQTYGLESRKLDINESQFAQELALKKLNLSGGGGTTDVGGTFSKATEDAWEKALAYGSSNEDGTVNEWKVWNYINQKQDILKGMGVDVNTLWAAQKKVAQQYPSGSSTSASTIASKPVYGSGTYTLTSTQKNNLEKYGDINGMLWNADKATWTIGGK